MTMLVSYPPPGVSPETLQSERILYVQSTLNSICYGIHICVFFSTIYFYLRTRPSRRSTSSKNKSKSSFISYTMIAFVFTLMACGTIIVGATAQGNIDMFINNSGFPGGPIAYTVSHYNRPANVVGNSAYVIASFLADGILLFRLRTVWRNNWIVLVLPSLAYICYTVLAILALVITAQPGADISTHISISILVPYWSLGIANNVFMTLLITYRLLRMRFKLTRSLTQTRTQTSTSGADVELESEHLKVYFSVSAILVESAALYSIVGIAFVVLYARNSDFQEPIAGVLDQVVCIAPELIVLRVFAGRAWSTKTETMLMNRMAPSGPGSQQQQQHWKLEKTGVEAIEFSGAETITMTSLNSCSSSTRTVDQQLEGESAGRPRSSSSRYSEFRAEGGEDERVNMSHSGHGDNNV